MVAKRAKKYLAKRVSQQKLEFELDLVGLTYNPSYLGSCGGRIPNPKCPGLQTEQAYSLGNLRRLCFKQQL